MINSKNYKSGKWLLPEEKEAASLYYEKAHFDIDILEYLDDPNEIAKREIPKMVRDHCYSRKEGFRNNVNPEILKHPCNLQLLTCGENLNKWNKNVNDCSITLKELYERIKAYKGNYPKHKLVLDLIYK